MKWLIVLGVIACVMFWWKVASPRSQRSGDSSGLRITIEPLPTKWYRQGVAIAWDARARAIIWPPAADADSPRSSLTTFDPDTGRVSAIDCGGVAPDGIIIPSLACDAQRSALYLFGGWRANGVEAS